MNGIGNSGFDILHLLSAVFIKSSLILFVVWMIAWALRQRSAVSRQWVWNLGLAALAMLSVLTVIPPFWDFPVVPAGDLVAARNLQPVYSPTFEESLRTIPVLLSYSLNTGLLTPSVGRMLLWLLSLFWLSGFLFFLWRVFRDLSRLVVTSRRAEQPPSQWDSAINDCISLVGLEQALSVRLSRDVQVPMIWGFRKPVVLLPVQAKFWEEERLRMVLMHEMVHAARHDHSYTLLGQVVSAFFWLNPFVWYAQKQQVVERELACDETVLSKGTDRIVYAEQLLEITRELGKARPHTAVAMAHHKGFNDRIQKVLDFRRYVAGISAQATRIGMMIMFMLAAPLATANMVVGNDLFEMSDLVNDLFHGNKKERANAAIHMGYFGYREAVPYLIDALMDTNPYSRVKAIKALRELEDESAIDPLIHQTRVKDPEIRYMAVWALGAFENNKHVSMVLLDAVNDEDPFVRQKAYMVLIEREELADPVPLFQELRNKDSSVREHITTMLGSICVLKHVKKNLFKQGRLEECTDQVLGMLHDMNAHVRAAAAVSLGRMGDVRAEVALKAALDDTEKEVRDKARNALDLLFSESL
ncbi:MAG: M56 family metallopeptidase [Gammaproteobacteria bacterium]